MTVHTDHTTVAPSSHEHGSGTGDAGQAYAQSAVDRRQSGTSATALRTVLALPRPVRIIGGAGVVVGGLLVIGVPIATLTPLLFLGGCLSMHLFMGHGQHGTAGDTTAAGPAEATPPRTDG